MKKVGRRVLIGYVAATVLLLAGLATVMAVHGRAGFYAIQGPRDVQAVEVKFLVFCVAWLYAGALIALSQYPELARRHAVFLVGLALLAFVYLNAIREPHRSVLGDFRAYYLGAADIAAHRPLSTDPGSLYLYPPLFAILLRPLAHLEIGVAAAAFRWVNHGALLLFAVLLYVALLRARIRRDVAGGLVFLALVASVPLTRTLIYLQVNVLVADAILASLLFYPRHVFLSALALTVAVHLKVYPLLLVIPFLLVRDWRWCSWFAASQLGVLLATGVAAGWTYYAQFLERMGTLEENGIRNVSVQSFLHNTLRMLGVDGAGWARPLGLVASLTLGALIARAGWPLIRQGVLHPDGRAASEGAASREAVVYSAYVVLPVVMLAVSPSVWEHHFVLLEFSMLPLILTLRTPREWWLFLGAYVAIFLVPVNAIYPVAYLRLAALAAVGGLFALLAARLRRGERVAPSAESWPRLMLARTALGVGGEPT